MSGNEITKKPATKMEKFKDLINNKMKDQVASILPNHLTPERMCKVLIVEASRNPKLMECTSISVAESVMLSAQLGLEPGGTLGHIYFIPYGNKCTPIIGYKGYLELARRSGQVARLDARVVYEGEKFDVSAGLHPNIEHSVRGDVDRSDDKIVAAYAVAVMSFELATAVSADGDDPHAKMPPIDITPIVGEDEPKEVNGMSDLGAALA